MKTWDIDDKVDAVYEMRMEQVNHAMRTGGPASGGLTVRDYFAAKVLGSFLTSQKFEGSVADYIKDAYNVADAMMAERERKKPQPCSVEEAFGI